MYLPFSTNFFFIAVILTQLHPTAQNTIRNLQDAQNTIIPQTNLMNLRNFYNEFNPLGVIVPGENPQQPSSFLTRHNNAYKPYILQNQMIDQILKTPVTNFQSQILPQESVPEEERISQPVQSQDYKTSILQQLYQMQKGQKLEAENKRKALERADSWRALVDKNFDQKSQLSLDEIDYYKQKYNMTSEQVPFCVVVPTFNNAAEDRYLRNIRSIVMQNYSNYHIVVIDDASTDNTGDLISSFLSKQTRIPKERYHISKNSKQMKAMYNLRRAAMEFCKPYQIFVVVDGDDELLGKQVLRLFSSFFNKQDIWFVYSNFLVSKPLELGYSHPLPQKVIEGNKYRSYRFVTSHLRAFYTKLFRNIRDKDLRGQDGEYFRAANDVAICIPTLQQAHKKVKYIEELTYVYNSETGQNNHYLRALEQRKNDHTVRTYASYEPLNQLFGNY